MTPDELAKKYDVVSLGLAKELKEAGVPQDKSLWYWVDFPLTPYLVMKCLSGYIDVMTGAFVNLGESSLHPLVATFHSGELGEKLPNGITTVQSGNEFIPISVDSVQILEFYEKLKSNTEANARAKMVLYLLNKGIIKKEDL